MKQINLLPDSYKNNLRLERIFKGAIAVQASALFLSILFALALNVHSDNLHEKVVVYSENLKDSKYLDSEKVIEDVKILSDKIERLKRLEASIEVPDSLTDNDINYIYSLLPQGVFSSTVSFNAEAGKIVFTGLSETNTNISEFVDALATSGEFAEIVIKNMTSKEKMAMVSFTLDIYYSEEVVQWE